ncbi:restriction endonuclease [Microbacterium sp. SD291]|uniref:restriction endonuclease n=1 Tax=Microbacterium sp. SD291 TaxID=2782007 RepID=UPI001A96BC9E|nr:restriction endonuclease [Microbacterium sp. SD291]MBO0979639.1 restriction endonuclease [Microbacterium sp. SD291]
MSFVEPPSAFLLDWQSAELAAVEHMRTLGFVDAQKTQAGADGGIDVESAEAAAQVKFYANPVGRPDIQRLRGAAHDYRLAVFYSTGGYTGEAVAYADQARVALFQMDPYGQAKPTSQLATLLAEPEHIQERKERLEELKALRYQLASASFEQDLRLYAQFVRQTPLNPEESTVYSHVASALEQSVTRFKTAVGGRQFQDADDASEEINKRIEFLGWITGTELRASYENLEAAISHGWSLDSSPGSDYLLHLAATGAFNLRDLAVKFLKDWQEILPDGVSTIALEDEELRKAAGMLLSASFDQSILSAELLHQVKESVRSGVQRVHGTATSIFRILFDKHMQLDLARPRSLVAGLLRVNALTDRINRQLNAS